MHTAKGFSSESSVRGKGRATAGLLQQVLPQGLLPLSWGCGQEPRHAGSGPNHLHMSLMGRIVLGNIRLPHTF